MSKLLKDIVLGLSVGDALGVPVEFQSRSKLKENPVTDMRAYGTHQQPKGTWSDDTSMALCLAEEVVEGAVNLERLGRKFIMWYRDGYWTPHGECFDIGNTTVRALHNGISQPATPADKWGPTEISSNGNGSLMRILPLTELTQNMDFFESLQLIQKVSSITHGHPLSVLCCIYLVFFAEELNKSKNKMRAYHMTNERFKSILQYLKVDKKDATMFYRLAWIDMDQPKLPYIYELPEEEIHSTGYVIHTLEASLWCLLNTDNYRDCVLKAVNLGDDTDTTGAVAGGLAGILYGCESIPEDWRNSLARLNELTKLVEYEAA